MTRPTESWAHEIDGARQRVGVTAKQYPTHVVLAFIDVESDGDPEAHRPGSQFYGLLQMGKTAGLDVGLSDVSVLDGEDGDPDTEDDVEAFLRLCERYRSRHEYNPYAIATLWKGGAGTARTVQELMAQGQTFEFALAKAERLHQIHNLQEYVRRFRSAMVRWSREVKSTAPVVEYIQLLPEAEEEDACC